MKTLKLLDEFFLDNILSLLKGFREEKLDLSVIDYLDDENLREDLKNHIFVGAFDNDALMGILRAKINDKKCSICIGLKEDIRHKGFASELLHRAIPELKKKNVEIIQAWIYSDNLASRKFASKNGFECIHRTPNHHYNEEVPVDDLMYVKNI